MTEKHNRILAAALGLQVIISVVVFWPSPPVTAGGEPLFPGLEVAEVTSLTVSDADGAEIELSQADGGWVLPEADSYPADASKVTTLLAKIVSLTSDRLVARSETSHSRLQVADGNFVRRVDFRTQDGSEHAFFLGSSPSYGASHVRIEGQNETYLCDGISSWEVGAGASSWIDASYVSVALDEVSSLTLENANGSFYFTKDEEGNWTSEQVAEGETVVRTEVTSVASQAGSLNIKEPLGKTEQAGYGMEAPLAQVTLVTQEQTITLTVGAQDADDSTYVVISSQSDYYARAHEYSVNRLVEATRDDFFEPLTTPTPEPTATPEIQEEPVEE